MLDQAPYVAKAERHSGQAVRASCAARRRSPGSFIGEAGLLCALDDGLAFVVDGILEPGEVTTTARESIQGAELQLSTVDTSLAVQTTDGQIVFEGLDPDEATRLVEAAGLPVNAASAADPAAAASGDGLPDLAPQEPPSTPSEEVSVDAPAIQLATVREATDAVDEFALADSPPAGLLTPTRDRADSSGAAEVLPHAERPSRSGKKRRRKRKAAAKRGKTGVGPSRWVPVAAVAILALAGLTFHWSVAVLLGCIGYPLGLYLAERAQKQALRRHKQSKRR